MKLDERALGIACIVGAMFSFTTQDALIKWLSGGYPLHEIVFVRAVLAAGLTLFMMQIEGGMILLRSSRPGLHIGRGLLLVLANSSFFMALAAMPIGEASAMFFVAPLMITVLSAVVLEETVGVRRWLGVIVGLAGVIVMFRPGAEVVRLVALLPVVAAAAYSSMQIMTRKLGVTDRASTMAFYVQLTFIFVGLAMGLVAGDGRFAPTDNPSLEFLLRAWRWPQPTDAILFMGIGVLSAAGAYLMSQAYRVCAAALVAPFEYVALPLAVMWGLVLWGEWPDATAMLGIALILGGGLYVLHRELLARAAGRAKAG
ncbi:MAG: DMT family transporter [Gammaproteobacteria bacterium]